MNEKDFIFGRAQGEVFLLCSPNTDPCASTNLYLAHRIHKYNCPLLRSYKRGQLYLIYHIMVSATLQSLISNFIFLGNYISWKLYFRISRQIPLDSISTASRFGTAISPLQISEKSHTASSEQTAPKKVTSP